MMWWVQQPLKWRQAYKPRGDLSHHGDAKHDLCNATNVTDETENPTEAFENQAHTMYWSLSTDGCAWLGGSDPLPTGSDTWRLPVCLHHSDYKQTTHSYLLAGATVSSLYKSYVFSFPLAIFKKKKPQSVSFLNFDICFSAKQTRMGKQDDR